MEVLMPTSSARRRHSLSLVKLAALHGINQPAVAHSRLNSSTWSPPHQQKTIMFLALLHGEEFPASTTNPFLYSVASCLEAFTWRGSLSSEKNAFPLFRFLILVLLTFPEVSSHRKKLRCCLLFSGGIYPPPLEQDDGLGFPLIETGHEAGHGGCCCCCCV